METTTTITSATAERYAKKLEREQLKEYSKSPAFTTILNGLEIISMAADKDELIVPSTWKQGMDAYAEQYRQDYLV